MLNPDKTGRARKGPSCLSGYPAHDGNFCHRQSADQRVWYNQFGRLCTERGRSAYRVHRAVQARSWPTQTPCAAHRQVEACSRDKKYDIHPRTSRTSITEGFMARSRRPGRPRKTGARKIAARKTIGRKTGARKTAGRKTAARKTAARKTVARKSGARKAGGRQATVRKTAARKTIGRKSATRKTAVRKTAAGRKIATRNTAPRKTGGRKTVARRTPNGRRRKPLENGTPAPPSTEPIPEEFPSEDMQRREPPSEEL
jgi:Histone H1-like nucleoprotein HC2